MIRPRCLVVDVDDTLYLERDYVHSGLRAVGEAVSRLGVPGFREVAAELSEDGLRARIFDEALGRLDAQHLLPNVPQLVQIYRRQTPMITLLRMHWQRSSKRTERGAWR